MSRWEELILSFMLAACLMLLQTANVFAAGLETTVSQNSAGHSEPDIVEPEESCRPVPEVQTVLTDIVSDQDELMEWMEQHSETGGTVFLGTDVTITQPVWIYSQREIIIDTGRYGFVFDGGTLPSANILITGEGVDTPVVNILRAGGGSPMENSWNNSLLELNITATGRDGTGGTALCISAEDTKNISMDALYGQGMIRSYGEGAIGLCLDVPMEAWCYQVEVSGNNSVAAYAPNGARLYYCKLTAQGDGAAAAAGNSVLLDSCFSSPVPSGVQSINRRAMEESFSRLYLPLKQNEYHLSAIDMLNTPAVFLNGGDGSVISRSFAVYWDIGTYDSIDTGTLGKTTITGSLAPALYGLGVFDDIPIELTVEVRDPDIPCISQIAVRELDGSRYVVLNFWQNYDPADRNVLLWRSDDEGETWWDATFSEDISWNGDIVHFTYDALKHPVWFQLEVIGTGESNIAVLDEKDGIFMGGNGGDRTGTDRGGIPSPGGEGGGSDGGNGNTSGDGSDRSAENGSDANHGFVADTAAAISSGVPSPDTAESDSLAAEAFAQTLPDKSYPESPAPEKAIIPVKEEENPVTGEPVNLDPEQSVPEPGISVNALTILFLSVAVLCSCGLLVLRFGTCRRWQNEEL